MKLVPTGTFCRIQVVLTSVVMSPTSILFGNEPESTGCQFNFLLLKKFNPFSLARPSGKDEFLTLNALLQLIFTANFFD